MSVTAFDSGVRVVVAIHSNDDEVPLMLSIGDDVSELGLTIEEAQRIIDGLTEGLAKLGRARVAAVER